MEGEDDNNIPVTDDEEQDLLYSSFNELNLNQVSAHGVLSHDISQLLFRYS